MFVQSRIAFDQEPRHASTMRDTCRENTSQRSALFKRSRPSFISVLDLLIFFALSALCSVGRAGAIHPTSFSTGVKRLPVITKRDFRFAQLTANGEALQSRIWSITRALWAKPGQETFPETH